MWNSSIIVQMDSKLNCRETDGHKDHMQSSHESETQIRRILSRFLKSEAVNSDFCPSVSCLSRVSLSDTETPAGVPDAVQDTSRSNRARQSITASFRFQLQLDDTHMQL